MVVLIYLKRYKFCCLITKIGTRFHLDVPRQMGGYMCGVFSALTNMTRLDMY